MALRIRGLLYEDQYTIAGAKKRLANDLRTGVKLRVVEPDLRRSKIPANFRFNRPGSR